MENPAAVCAHALRAEGCTRELIRGGWTGGPGGMAMGRADANRYSETGFMACLDRLVPLVEAPDSAEHPLYGTTAFFLIGMAVQFDGMLQAAEGGRETTA